MLLVRVSPAGLANAVRHGLIMLGAAVLAPACWPGLASADTLPAYAVDTSKATDGMISLVLEIPDTVTPRPTRVSARSLPVARESQIGDVTCDGAPLASDGQGWRMPVGCRSVHWTVTLPRVAGDVAADDQTSVWFTTGWGIVADTAFLRPDSWNGPADIRISEAGLPDRSVTLPPLEVAPAFYLIGRPPSLEVGGSDGSLVYVADHPEEVLRQVPPMQHAAALSYLRGVIGPAGRRDLRELIVVWLRVSRSRNGFGGAAGENAMLVNYLAESDSPTSAEALMPFVILLHEQFHQLLAEGVPLWAGESLAQFYALKAATRTARDGAAVASLWSDLLNETPAKTGLLAIQRQVLEQGDTSNYGLFYSKGPMFWLELDRAIQAASNGAQTLDSLLPLVLKSGFDADGGLSAPFRAELRQLPDEQLDRLIDFYLN